jgi:hypothetical protein
MSDHKRPEDGWLDGCLDGDLSESESRDLAAWRRSDERGLRELVDAMLFEQQIRAAVVAREQQAAFQPIGSSTIGDMATDRGLLNRSASHRRTRDRWAFWSLLSLIVALTVAAATGLGGDLRRLAHSLRLIPAYSRIETKQPSESAGVPARPTPSQTSSLPTTNNGPRPNRAEARSANSGKAGPANRFCRVVWVTRAKGHKVGLSANETVIAPGDRLGSGHVRLVAGTAELLFDNGVWAICTGPADLELRGPSHAWLHAGEAVFRVPPAGIGFKLETKEAVIVDLGTEFGVRAENVDGPNTGAGTELQVYEGEVLANTKPGKPGAVVVPRRVLGGQALRIGDEASDRNLGWPVAARVRALAPQREYLDEDRNERLASLVMWYYAAESLPCLDLRYGIDFHGRKLNPEGFRGAWKKRTDGLGYTMEYAIPWSLLNVADNPPPRWRHVGMHLSRPLVRPRRAELAWPID